MDTIQTYTTKSFKNKGVAGSTPAKKGDAHQPIGPSLAEFSGAVQNIVHSPVKDAATGNGVDGVAPVSKFNTKAKSAGSNGIGNMNHSA